MRAHHAGIAPLQQFVAAGDCEDFGSSG